VTGFNGGAGGRSSACPEAPEAWNAMVATTSEHRRMIL
jgi:hypothetical protein